jgi:hypothetical protein
MLLPDSSLASSYVDNERVCHQGHWFHWSLKTATIVHILVSTRTRGPRQLESSTSLNPPILPHFLEITLSYKIAYIISSSACHYASVQVAHPAYIRNIFHANLCLLLYWHTRRDEDTVNTFSVDTSTTVWPLYLPRMMNVVQSVEWVAREPEALGENLP